MIIDRTEPYFDKELGKNVISLGVAHYAFLDLAAPKDKDGVGNEGYAYTIVLPDVVNDDYLSYLDKALSIEPEHIYVSALAGEQ